jgi:hypothetical protein
MKCDARLIYAAFKPKLTQKNGYLSKLLTKDSLLLKEIVIHQQFYCIL